jgi:hypothetical protein
VKPGAAESDVAEEVRRIGGRKYLLRLGRLPATGDRPERWKVDLHRIWLGHPSEMPEFSLVRPTKEELMRALEQKQSLGGTRRRVSGRHVKARPGA